MITQLRTLLKVAFLVTILWFGNLNSSKAQGTSNKGTDFWVAYTGHLDGTNSRLTLFITSQQNAVVTVDAGGSILPIVNLSANQAVSVLIDPTVRTNTYVGTSDIVETKKGIHITSDVPVVVYSLISFAARSAATLVLPTKALGNEYFAMAYNQFTNANSFSEFTILGVEDGTKVEITPTANSTNNLHLVGETFEINLNKGDVYQFQSLTDVTGSRIKTIGNCKPIAVFSGSTFNGFCEPGSTVNPTSRDNLYQQLFPVSAWGKNFITAPFFNASKGSVDIFRVFIAEDETTLTINGSTNFANTTSLSNPYKKGSIVTFHGNTANSISADKPISVAQFQITQNCNSFNNPGDPEMTILNPVEQTLKDVTLFSALRNLTSPPTNITAHYINILLKTADIPTLTLDGVKPNGSFVQINSEYSYIIVDVTASSNVNPTHRIICNNGFSAIAYGYGQVESYAYLAGTDIKNLNFNLQIFEPGNSIAKSSVCIGRDYNVTLQIPYTTNKIVWNLNNGTIVETINLPTPTQTTINGLPAYLYQYKLSASNLNAAGLFSLKATVTNPAPTSCSPDEDISISFDVLPVPISSFTASNLQTCIASPLSFTDTSTPNSTNIVKWYWDYGDGVKETKTAAGPVNHSYSAPGDYIVSLLVESEGGCVSSPGIPLAIHVNKTPEASFTAAALKCEDQPIQFTDKSLANEGVVVKWNWDFGDGNSSSAQNPAHTYTTPGKYMVKLIIETDKGCISSVFNLDVLVNVLPTVDFEVPDFCLADGSAQFTNKTTISDGTTSQLTYLWDFGDPLANAQRPNTSTAQNASHRYTKAGRYTVKLTVKSPNGCEETLSKEFVVNGSVPKADFAIKNPTGLCSYGPVEFEDKVIVELDEEVTKIEWIFDLVNNPNVKVVDDEPSLRAAPTRIYSHKYPTFTSPASITYQVKMLAYTGGTCVNIITKSVTVFAVPEVQFDVIADICSDSGPIQLTQAKEIHGILNGTGTYSGKGVSASGIFNQANAGIGTHTLTYTFLTDNGCTDSKTQNITVNPAPKTDIGPDLLVLEGRTVKLPATVSGNIVSYKWFPSTFLDKDDILIPEATPTDDITYTLTVTTDKGCTAISKIFIKVLKMPQVPNTFTPNGDGVNDTWNVKYLEDYPGATVDIFNRYGVKLYQIVNYLAPWDGTKDGSALPVGTYYYVIHPKNERKPMYGSVTIVR
ncbi:MAG: PKD domain-containing protein [Daejeonella sp.]|uniref:PKD domain-containing protein n=1 Tax=Daejeonella sp. TaxID=2805397 RepID=UPI003C75DD9D